MFLALFLAGVLPLLAICWASSFIYANVNSGKEKKSKNQETPMSVYKDLESRALLSRF